MKNAINFIKQLKVFNGNEEVTGRIRSLKGWLITLNAILFIWNQLKAEHDFTFLLQEGLTQTI